MAFGDDILADHDLSGEIIGAAIEVQKAIRPELREKTYENALCIELAERNIHFSQQDSFIVYYKGKPVDKFIPDLIVSDSIIIEIKTSEKITDEHVSQLLNYLHITKLKLGLILNFKTIPIGIKRLAL